MADNFKDEEYQFSDIGGIEDMDTVADDIMEESLHTIDSSQAEFVMGHLEIKGFEMHKGYFNEHGLEKNIFHRFEKVISGHFHKKSDDGQIFYLGAQYEMTWSDYMCPKGFHMFDTDTRELTRIPNPLRIHKKIIYDDEKENYNQKVASHQKNVDKQNKLHETVLDNLKNEKEKVRKEYGN